MLPLLATLALAQADAPPPDFGPWLANLMYLALTGAAIMGGLAAWKSYRSKDPEATPQPFMVKPVEELATKAQLTEVHGRIKRERQEIDAHFTRIEATHLASSQRIDNELLAIRDSIQESRDAGEQRVNGLRDKLDEQTKLIISVIREAKN